MKEKDRNYKIWFENGNPFERQPDQEILNKEKIANKNQRKIKRTYLTSFPIAVS